MALWLSGNIVGRINEVTLRRDGLVLRWVTDRRYTVLVLNQATQANSAFHPSGVGKSSTGLFGWGEDGVRLVCQVACNTVISHMAGDFPYL